MKANELMLGDWVYNNVADITFQVYPQFFSQWHNQPEQFKAIIHPIPLTPEILEKNGWKDISTHTLKGCDTFRLRLNQRSFDYTLTLKMRDYFRLDSYDDRVYTLCELNFGFKYVHQLQHALRLCGIEKEIEL